MANYREPLEVLSKPIIHCVIAPLMAVLLCACGGQSPSGDGSAICKAPADHALSDIQSVVDWINAMDKPLSLPCFVQSLPRPLATHSAYSIFSAQPSLGQRSPRVIFFIDELILTVATDQDEDDTLPAQLETHLLELSFLVDAENLLTTKAELKFPVTERLADSAPYQKIDFDESHSNCFACHGLETQRDVIEGYPIYQSQMLASSDPLPLNNLIAEHNNCDAIAEPHRCAMLAAIVSHGVLVPTDFPDGALTIYDN